LRRHRGAALRSGWGHYGSTTGDDHVRVIGDLRHYNAGFLCADEHSSGGHHCNYVFG